MTTTSTNSILSNQTDLLLTGYIRQIQFLFDEVTVTVTDNDNHNQNLVIPSSIVNVLRKFHPKLLLLSESETPGIEEQDNSNENETVTDLLLYELLLRVMIILPSNNNRRSHPIRIAFMCYFHTFTSTATILHYLLLHRYFLNASPSSFSCDIAHQSVQDMVIRFVMQWMTEHWEEDFVDSGENNEQHAQRLLHAFIRRAQFESQSTVSGAAAIDSQLIAMFQQTVHKCEGHSLTPRTRSVTGREFNRLVPFFERKIVSEPQEEEEEEDGNVNEQQQSSSPPPPSSAAAPAPMNLRFIVKEKKQRFTFNLKKFSFKKRKRKSQSDEDEHSVDVDPQKFAEQLTLYLLPYLHKIKPRECTLDRWEKNRNQKKNYNHNHRSGPGARAPNLTAFAAQINRITLWIQQLLLQKCQNMKERVFYMRYFCQVADELTRIGNFAGGAAVVAAFMRRSISKMKIEAQLPQKSVVTYIKIREDYSRSMDFKRLRRLYAEFERGSGSGGGEGKELATTNSLDINSNINRMNMDDDDDVSDDSKTGVDVESLPPPPPPQQQQTEQRLRPYIPCFKIILSDISFTLIVSVSIYSLFSVVFLLTISITHYLLTVSHLIPNENVNRIESVH